MWTVNDFTAYGILSRWNTNGQLACPVCIRQQRLKNGGKFLWFDCNWCFLPTNHAVIRNRTSFRKCRIVLGRPLRRICGKQLYAEVEHYPIITIDSDFQTL